MGDSAWYFIGRKQGGRVLRLLAAFSDNPNEQIRKTKRTFEKYGLRCLLVAKFIPGIDEPGHFVKMKMALALRNNGLSTQPSQVAD